MADLGRWWKNRTVEFLRPGRRNAHEDALRDEADRFTFEKLKEATRVDFVASGVNMTAHEPGTFSASATPNFQVVDAVAISLGSGSRGKIVHVDEPAPRFAAICAGAKADETGSFSETSRRN